MIELQIPNFGRLGIEHLVLDYNGTLALDGDPLPGVAERLHLLAERLEVEVLTADTHGTVREKLAGLPLKVTVLAHQAGNTVSPYPEDQAKRDHLQQLGPQRCAFMGNGRNDRLALRTAALGIGVLQTEGASPLSLTDADVMVMDICAGLDLLLHPTRLMATLRC